jgi:hypothetical protein
MDIFLELAQLFSKISSPGKPAQGAIEAWALAHPDRQHTCGTGKQSPEP